jgi:dolichyl-phosphate-mannose--protein O-mannosyl transferase
VVGVAATWLPWFRYDDRPIFSYYASVSLPFLVLGATLLLGELLGRANASPLRRSLGTAAAGSVVVLTVLAFAWFWPIWTDQLITRSQWLQRMWFQRWI